jgi:hypothetical protein
VDSYGSGKGTVTVSCEQNSETSGSIKTTRIYEIAEHLSASLTGLRYMELVSK